MSLSEIQLFNILRNKLGESEAQSLVEYVKSQVNSEIESKKEIFLTKEDKVDIMRSIYLVGLIQFLAIVGSEIGIINIMIK
ncbi:MAG: hypothetical protein ABI855_10545 [Bacteroidota bacterium]